MRCNQRAEYEEGSRRELQGAGPRGGAVGGAEGAELQGRGHGAWLKGGMAAGAGLQREGHGGLAGG